MNVPTFEELYSEYRGFVLALLNRSYLQESDIQDIAQEVWIAVYRHMSILKPSSSYTKYLAIIVRHRIADFFRHEKLRQHDDIEEYEHLAIEEPLPLADKIVVRDALMALPEKQRDAIYRIYFLGERVSDIAKKANITRRTLDFRRENALKALRSKLADNREMVQA